MSLIPLSMVIIDDNLDSLEMMQDALHEQGVKVHCFSEPGLGLDFIKQNRPQIVMTDLVMPIMDGIETLEHIMAFDPTIDVILMTAYYSTESAVEAIRKGATDYLDKPISIETLRDRVGKLARLHRARIHALDPDHAATHTNYFEGMVGNSPEMWHLYSKIQRVAPHYRTLLLHGATGTGKELVAQALHHLSGVKQEFVPLNCSAVVETLFESELFGHVKGAFTGATDNKIGLFEYAHNGTLFLDEVGDMPLSTQAKLLRALQNQEVQQLGSLRARKVNVRVIAATHRDLRSMIQQGGFREDLFYRLSMVELEVPPLVDRHGDIEVLARTFLAKWAKQYTRSLSDFTHRALLVLRRHHWPGNVRELENAIGHAAMMSAGPVIDTSDLPQYLLQPAPGSEPESLTQTDTIPSLTDREKELVFNALKKSRSNQSEAARILEISRDKLRYKMKKYGLV